MGEKEGKVSKRGEKIKGKVIAKDGKKEKG
jgi:hypothetical protein